MRWEESDPKKFVRVFAWFPVSLHSNPRKKVWMEWVYRWEYEGLFGPAGRWHTGYCLPEELADYGRKP